MNDFVAKVANAKDLTVDEQKKAGTPVSGAMDSEYVHFLATLKTMLKDGEIDPFDPKSFLKMDVYNGLDEEWQDKADITLQNIAGQLRMLSQYLAGDNPEESPQLKTMVDQLWQTKQVIEEHHDVFKF